VKSIPNGGTQFYQTTLEPMQMLAQYRAGLPVVNHVFQPAQQFLPQGLPAFDYGAQFRARQNALTPVVAAASRRDPFGGGAGPGGDGAPGGVGTDGGADGSGGAGGGGGGGK
jgi:hypothetical protein